MALHSSHEGRGGTVYRGTVGIENSFIVIDRQIPMTKIYNRDIINLLYSKNIPLDESENESNDNKNLQANWLKMKEMISRNVDTIISYCEHNTSIAERIKDLLLDYQRSNSSLIFHVYTLLQANSILVLDYNPNYDSEEGNSSERQTRNNSEFITELRNKLIPDSQNTYASNRSR